MDLDVVRSRLEAALADRAPQDGVRLEVHGGTGAGVRVQSSRPSVYYNQAVAVDAEGVVTTVEPDDGFTAALAPLVEVGRASTEDEAVSLLLAIVLQQVEALVAVAARSETHNRPRAQPALDPEAVGQACELWQGGRDVGSTPLRGAARALTGHEHYFRADFITKQDEQARRHPDRMLAAATLLRAVNAASFHDAAGWGRATGYDGPVFAGRGLDSKPQDDQIERALRGGFITMPLWGVSLDRAAADSFGTRFRLELVGKFPGVAAWVASGMKQQEWEIVTGGRYEILEREEQAGTTNVRLRWVGACGDAVGDDPLMLAVLAQLDGVRSSELVRDQAETEISGRGDRLQVRLGGDNNKIDLLHVGDDPGSTTTTARFCGLARASGGRPFRLSCLSCSRHSTDSVGQHDLRDEQT